MPEMPKQSLLKYNFQNETLDLTRQYIGIESTTDPLVVLFTGSRVD